MFKKGFALIAVALVGSLVAALIKRASGADLSEMFSIMLLLFCSSRVKKDYYLMRRQSETIWPALAFLHRKAVLAATILTLIVVVSMVDGPAVKTASADNETTSSNTSPAPASQSAEFNPELINREIASAAGLSGNECSLGREFLLKQTLSFRNRNVPVDQAIQAVSMKNASFEYNYFMDKSVRELYRSPDKAKEDLQDGSWMNACIFAVRGF